MAFDTRVTSVDELLRLAREDLARNSLSSAEKSLEQAVLLNNQVPDTYYLLGHVYSKKGKFKKAILAFERALTLDPFHTDAAIALSSLYNDVGKYKDGASVFFKTKKRLSTTQPGHDPRIDQNLSTRHYELGLLYMRFERFEEAQHEFAKSFRLEPDNVGNAVQISKCLSRMGNREGAMKFLKRVIESHPKSAELKIQLGIFYHASQKLKDANREWQDALTLDPDNKSAQMYLNMIEN